MVSRTLQPCRFAGAASALLLLAFAARPAAAGLGPVGAELPLNASPAGLQSAPTIAAFGGGYVVVWESAPNASTDRTLYARGFSTTGAEAFEQIHLGLASLEDDAAPDVAPLADGFVVAWQGYDLASESDEVVARRYGPTGFPLGAAIPVATGTGNASSPAVAGGNDGFAVAWVTSVGTDTEIALRRYDAAGAEVATTLAPSTTSSGLQLEPDVARTPDGGFVVAWQSLDQDGDGWGVFARRFDAGGDPVEGMEWQVPGAGAGSQTQPAIAVGPDGGFLVVWNDFGRDGDADGLWAQAFSPPGDRIGAERQVATRSSGRQSSPAVVALAGGYVVAWRSSEGDGSGSGIFARQFDAQANPLSGEVLVNATTAGSQNFPGLAAAGFEAMTAWQSEVGADTEVRGRRLGESPIGPCIAGATTLCLTGDRFEVRATWRTKEGATGTAQAVELTPDTGYLWFFSPTNVEALIKVLDGCGINQRFWVFAGGLTDVAVELRVRDAATGEIRSYANPLGTPFEPIQDTSAFATCGAH